MNGWKYDSFHMIKVLKNLIIYFKLRAFVVVLIYDERWAPTYIDDGVNPCVTMQQDTKYVFSREHDDVIKWKHFPRNWPFVRGIHRSRWIPHAKASDTELWYFLWSASE